MASVAPAAASPAPVGLGAADGFAVLAGTTVTSAGVSTVTGDLGVSPGTAVTGFGPGVVSGSTHAGDAGAAAAHADLATAYLDATGRSPLLLASGVLDGLTLTPGVHETGAAMSLAGTLTLDAEGDPGAVFILQAGSTLATATDSHVTLAGGAQACNVFWQVGSSATLGAASLLRGSILAFTSITIGAGVTIDGRALARDGAVTMDSDTVTVPQCDRALSTTAPAITPFSATLTGITRTVHAAVGAWTIGDARGTGTGYSVTVSATAPTVDGSASAAGTGAALVLTPRAPVAVAGNPAEAGTAAVQPQTLGATAATIVNAPAGTGRGRWDVPADSASAKSLAIVIPADAAAGAFSSTLTFTTAPPVG